MDLTGRNAAPYIPLEELGEYGVQTAASIELPGMIPASRTAGEVFAALRRIKAVHRQAAAFAAEHKTIPQALEWLLDNWYIAEREGRQAAARLKNAGKLRRTGAGGAYTIALADALIQSGRGELSAERIQVFITHTQTVYVLDEKEIFLLIDTLKGALVVALADVCGLLFTDEALGDIMGSLFTSLRLLTNLDAEDILEAFSQTEQTLRRDPAGAYKGMDEQTRQDYRREIGRLAKKHGMPEHAAAAQVLKLAENSSGRARHVGYYIFEKPLGAEKKRRTGGLYIGGIVLTSAFLTLLTGILLDNLAVSILLVFPISQIVKNVVDFFVIRSVRPRHIHRMNLEEGVPRAGRSLCVISALLSGPESGGQYAGLLEEYRLANRECGENLLFGILADYPESTHRDLSGAQEWLAGARAAVEGLNKKYGGGFVLLIRDRVLNPRDNRYMGWERKRGAILELTRLLLDEPSSLRVEAGTKLMLNGVRYLITLDGDTRLTVGAAREMIGAMLHPLNAPVIDQETGAVTAGTGLMQPRVAVDLMAADRSDFTRIFAGQGGIDPYGSAASDVYEDLFGEGTFTGKGILDVAAYHACLDQAFPENAVLSHDLLEGAYLHASYLGDVELTDGYPYKVLSYFQRMHRWIRGDWQVLPWLFDRVKNARGETVRNPLGSVSRWKIFDNLRRSMVPVFTTAALLTGMLVGGMSFLWAGMLAVLSALSSLLLSWAELLVRRDSVTKARYHSTIISGFAGVLLQTITQLIFLPFEAWVCLAGAATALFRMYVSKRNMLAWVTAADMERKTGESIWHYYYKMFPGVLIGLIVILFSRYVSAAAVGIVWLLSPLYAGSLSRRQEGKRHIPEENALYLSRAAGDIWRYFEDFLTPEDHFLPPDNWQEQPAAGLAHRTSPTNIGLALLSCLSAIDLHLCHAPKALGFIQNLLATLERMDKWNGHLYNWYDTRTLRSLLPRYVSTVDSGNLAGCLIALREGLLELGEQGLAAQAGRLYEAMDFGHLFDRKRKLFYIGWDPDRDAATQSWYDLMASEARQTSYIAIAKGDVPSRHWRKLGRALVSQDNFSGMASWTGTMFEYLMPNLLMPCYKNSLLYESMKFCVYVQKQAFTPWGISESAFYAFDPSLNYSYKAHGVQRLAFKRGLDREKVISPYSTFLALPLDVRGAVRNLKRLERLGGQGRYGFYEALDFTPSRQTGGKYEIVRTFMAHHLGMSLLAINNVLGDNRMQKRFMRERSMAAFSEFLQEKVPVGQVVLRQPPREVPEKPVRAVGVWFRETEGVDALRPASSVLSNGGYHVLVTESGQNRSMAGDLMLTRFESKQLDGSMGIGFFLKTGDGFFGLQPMPYFEADAEWSAQMSGGSVWITGRRGTLQSVVETQVPPNELGELRRVTLRNLGDESVSCELFCCFEPVLQAPADYFAHPAFSKLGIETSLLDGALVIKRRKNGESGARFMAVAASEQMEFDTDRQAALGRYGLMQAASRPAGGTLGTVLDPCVLLRVRLHLKPRSDRQVSFSICVGERGREAVASARRILGAPANEGPAYPDQAAARLGMNTADMEAALERLPDLLFPTESRSGQAALITADGKGQMGLWPFGISGDLPILTAYADADADIPWAVGLVKAHSFLRLCGVSYDLVLLLSDGGDYRRPVRSGLSGEIGALGLEAVVGARAGVHLVDASGDVSSILARSARVLRREEDRNPPRRNRLPEAPPCPDPERTGASSWHYGKDGSFVFETGGVLPPLIWSHMLANERFGYIAADCGAGHMWHLNARENKMTPWLNDPLASRGAERLTLLRDGRALSLFAAGDGLPCTVTYGFGFAVWEKEIDGGKITTTAFVPPDTAARVLLIEGTFRPGDRIAYFAELLLGADEKERPYVTTAYQSGRFTAKGSGEFQEQTFSLTASAAPEGFTCDKTSWLCKNLDEKTGAGLDPCFGAVFPAEDRLVLVSGCEDARRLADYLPYNRAETALGETRVYWRELVQGVTVETPDENLNRYLNGWAVYQTIACRIFGRSSIYQSGGAYGFRDQLQDVSALICRNPALAEEQLILACAHQFEKGDVQHWWHPTGRTDTPDKGVRTRCSDDLLWLPYVLCEYVEKTGHMEICERQANYIRSEPLEPQEHERYEAPAQSPVSEDMFRHAARAVELALQRGFGEHGLARMGTGDWNDGMNLVGAKGDGESVWLTWFLCHVLERFSALCARRGEAELAARCEREAVRCAEAANRAWDGEWFLRGYYDSGDTLGSAKDTECRIDAIAQGFATLTRHADRQKTDKALDSAVKHLFDRENQLVRLFTPPFEDGEKNPGYIRGYAPGLRENGGQYTHGAIWLAMGCFRANRTEDGYAILKALLPQNHPTDVYKAEPYVIAADVYSNLQHVGRGGWSWYTGASGWYYRTAMEELLGVKMRDGRLFIEPNLPESWDGYVLRWRTGSRDLRIEARRADTGYEILVDGKPGGDAGIPVMAEDEIKSF